MAGSQAAAESIGRIGRNTAFNTLRATLGTGLSFATGIVIARGLGPTEAGVYTLVIWVAIAASTILAAGLGSAVTKFVAQHDPRSDERDIASVAAFGIRGLAAAAVGSLVIVAASGVLASVLNVPDAQTLFALSGVIILASAAIDILTAPIIGMERQGLLVPLKTVWAFVWLIAAAFTLLAFDASIETLIWVQIVIWIATAILHLLVVAKIMPLRSAARLPAARRKLIAGSAIALTASSALELVIFKRSEIFIIGYFNPPADVAYYSVAYSISEALQQIVPMALAFAVMPTISRAFAGQDLQFARKTYEGQLRITALVVLPVAVAGAVLSRHVIRVFYGSAFEAAATPLAILLFTAGIGSMATCAMWVLVSANYERVVLWLTAVVAAVNVVLGIVLVSSFGVAGAVAAVSITQAILMVLSMSLVWRLIGFGFPARGVVLILVANLPVLLAVSSVSAIFEGDAATLALGLVVTLPAYAAGLWATRALTPFERQYLRGLIPTLART